MAASMRERALVTGASVGIGRAFAEELALRGRDLVLVARDAARLEQAAHDLSRRHSVAVEVLVADLLTDEGVAAVAARLASLPAIDLLVNNAGRGSHGEFAAVPPSEHLELLRLNVAALVELTHAALRPMLERRHGAVLNVSSVAAFQPVPREAVYSATKAFVLQFTEALYEELRGTGVTVSALCPGLTHSEFQLRSGTEPTRLPSFMWQEASAVARAGLDALEAGRALVVPGLHNKVLGHLSNVTPRSLARAASGAVVRRLA